MSPRPLSLDRLIEAYRQSRCKKRLVGLEVFRGRHVFDCRRTGRTDRGKSLMFNYEATKTTKELLAQIKHWAVTYVQPHARSVDDTYSLPDQDTIDAIAAQCPITNSPLDFWSSGPGVRGRED